MTVKEKILDALEKYTKAIKNNFISAEAFSDKFEFTDSLAMRTDTAENAAAENKERSTLQYSVTNEGTIQFAMDTYNPDGSYKYYAHTRYTAPYAITVVKDSNGDPYSLFSTKPVQLTHEIIAPNLTVTRFKAVQYGNVVVVGGAISFPGGAPTTNTPVIKILPNTMCETGGTIPFLSGMVDFACCGYENGNFGRGQITENGTLQLRMNQATTGSIAFNFSYICRGLSS